MNKENFVHAMKNLKSTVESDVEKYENNGYSVGMIEYSKGQLSMINIVLGLIEDGVFDK